MSLRGVVALVGDRSSDVPAHPRIEAIAPHLGVDTIWIGSAEAGRDSALDGADGIWVIPGSPYASRNGVLSAIRRARERHIPYLGTCGGFQHAVVEYARNVLGIPDADDTQYAPSAPRAIIVPLRCSLAGQQAGLHVQPGTRLASALGTSGEATVTYHCSYGVSPDFAAELAGSSLIVSAWDEMKAPRAIEIAGHPFFIGTLFQPELSSRPGSIHPLISAFITAVRAHTAG
jgi:CTP synthase (UTP-ammonia lyase)